MRKTLKTLLICCVALFAASSAGTAFWQSSPAIAQSGEPTAASVLGPSSYPADSLKVEDTDAGVLINWAGQVVAGANAPMIQDATGPWRMVQIGDRLLPAQLISVVVKDVPVIAEGKQNPKATKAPLAPQMQIAESAPWSANVPFVEIPVPQSATGEKYPDLARKPNPALPGSPVIVLREGYVRNLHVAVLAVTPIYAQNGVARAATRIQATVQGVRLLKSQDEVLDQFDVNGAGKEPLHSLTIPGQGNAPEAPPGPTNDLANANNVYKVLVAQTGIQLVMFNSLQPSPGALAAANWHVRYNGQDIPIVLTDVNANNQFDSGDFIKFYAPYVGDRFNTTSVYWLSYEGTSGARMTTAPKTVGTAPASSQALERGQWFAKTLYNSLFPGDDDDHFFAGKTQASYPVPSANSPVNFNLNGILPALAGNTAITLIGTGTTGGWHNGEFTLNGAKQLVTWAGIGAIPAPTATFSIGSPALASVSGAFRVKSEPNIAIPALTTTAGVDEVLLEAVKWERRVALNFTSNITGATFFGLADGTYAYQLSSLPINCFLLDITSPLAPVIISKDGAATSFQFQDGPGRAYLMEGPQAATPAVVKHNPSNLTGPLNKNVLYVVPGNLQSSLGPLLTLRTNQGFQPQAVTLESIYDSWSFGQVSALAIRSFLQYAAATWAVPPVAVTLVGTSSYDPFNYLGDYGENKLTLPPYLGEVDPYIKETACDTCYAELDGVDPTDAAMTPLPDLLFGRLPVKDATELTTMVNKIVGHETAAFGAPVNTWRSRIGMVAGNYQYDDGSTDGAGNFAAFSEATAALQPPTIKLTRVYYDPCLPHAIDDFHPPCTLQKTGLKGAPTGEAMQAGVVDLFNSGNSVILYNGHGNVVQISEQFGKAKFLETTDMAKLNNAATLPVVLQMTCYTSQFDNNYYQTLDEALVLKANGGALATWGATGLGVAHGHDALQRGFFNALWRPSAPGKTGPRTPGTARVGELTMMGYNDLALNGYCCQDTIRTFVLLGDPLTSVRMQAPRGIFLPVIYKR